MKETPILFSAPMVRAIQSGAKTQTRRIVKPQPSAIEYWKHGEPSDKHDGICSLRDEKGHGWTIACRKFKPFYGLPKRQEIIGGPVIEADRLWVKETHSFWCHSFESVGVEYAAGGEDKIVEFPNKVGMPPLEVQCRKNIGGGRRKRPSIFMPRWATRITLEITGVRVERLQDINRNDAIAEGIEKDSDLMWKCYNPKLGWSAIDDPCISYRTLWESINGPGSWAANPWIWRIEFLKL